MVVIVNEDSNITVSKSTGEDSIHVEIGEHRGSVEHIYVSEGMTVAINLAQDGFRISFY